MNKYTNNIKFVSLVIMALVAIIPGFVKAEALKAGDATVNASVVVSTPFISTTLSTPVEIGDSVTIIGSAFNGVVEETLFIDNGTGLINPAITYQSSTKLTFTVPNIPAGDYKLYMFATKGESNHISLKVIIPAHITKISPTTVKIGEKITLEGTNLEGVTEERVMITNSAGKTGAAVVESTATKLVILAPNVPAGKYTLTVLSDKGTSNPVNFTVVNSPIHIESTYATPFKKGDHMTINGAAFDGANNENRIIITDIATKATRGAKIISFSPSQIVIEIPDVPYTNYTVSILGDAGESNKVVFSVVAPVAAKDTTEVKKVSSDAVQPQTIIKDSSKKVEVKKEETKKVETIKTENVKIETTVKPEVITVTEVKPVQVESASFTGKIRSFFKKLFSF